MKLKNYKNFTISVEQIKGAIVDVVAKDEKEAKQIVEQMLENEQIEPDNFIENKIKILSKSITNTQKEELIRQLVKDFENLSPNQIKEKAKEQNFNPNDIYEEILLRREIL